MSAFIALAVALTLGAIALVAVPLIRVGGKGYWGSAMLSAVLIGMAVFFSYGWISDYPWPAGHEEVPGAKIDELQKHLTANPGDSSAWISLGKEHLRQERYAEARDAFRQALTLDPTGNNSSDELRMAYAEAAIMADPETLAGEAGQIVEQVLQRHPEDPKALWYGGMAAISRGDNQGARARWSRLLELSPPEEVRRVLEKQLAALEEPQTTSGELTGEQPATTMPSISVQITVAPELSATTGNLGNQAALFLIARLPGESGPPLAVVRGPVSGFPVDIGISDADRMRAEPAMAAIDTIRLIARISRTGDAAAAPGDLYGEALWQRGSEPAVPLVIDRVME